MLDDIIIPVIEAARTANGWLGKSSVPAITSGVLGSSEKPRKVDIAK